MGELARQIQSWSEIASAAKILVATRLAVY